MHAPSSKQPSSSNKKDTTPIYQIATTYAQQNNIPMALQTIDRALMVDPKSVQALVYKGDLYAKQHDDAKAVAAYDDAIVAAPSDDEKAQIMVREAGYFVAEKKNAQGEAILTQVITQYPKVPAGFVAYGDFYAQQHQWDKAADKLEAALALDPDNAPALLSLGEISMQSGEGQRQRRLPETLHAGLARRSGIRFARASVFSNPQLRGRARLVWEEFRNTTFAGNAKLRGGGRLRAEELQRGRPDFRRTRQERARLPRSESAVAFHRRKILSKRQSVHESGGGVQTPAADDA